MMIRACLQVVAKPMLHMSKKQMRVMVMLTQVLQPRPVVMLVLPQQCPWIFEF